MDAPVTCLLLALKCESTLRRTQPPRVSANSSSAEQYAAVTVQQRHAQRRFCVERGRPAAADAGTAARAPFGVLSWTGGGSAGAEAAAEPQRGLRSMIILMFLIKNFPMIVYTFGFVT